jgi:hypothetical protein
MDNIFIISAVISIIFLIAKFIEMRFIEKENKPLKLLIRDTLLVYVSVICGYFIVTQVTPVVQKAGSSVTPVFTDSPDF